MSCKLFSDPDFYDGLVIGAKKFKEQSANKNKTEDEFLFDKKQEFHKKFAECFVEEEPDNKKTEVDEICRKEVSEKDSELLFLKKQLIDMKRTQEAALKREQELKKRIYELEHKLERYAEPIGVAKVKHASAYEYAN